LATLGGSQVLGIENLVGNFETDKFFDALVIDPTRGSFDLFESDSDTDIFQKFIFCGSANEIANVFVAGREVHSK
jgi:guanine deaminase